LWSIIIIHFSLGSFLKISVSGARSRDHLCLAQ
jgi:hypothetical protein